MIRTIVKRSGEKEPFEARKVNDWGRWGGNGKVDWSHVVMKAVATLPEEVSSHDLQNALIDVCLEEKSWGYYEMAGRLYAPQIWKTIHPNGLPTLKELHAMLVDAKLLLPMDYSDADYAALNDIIDHTLDFNTPHFSLQYFREKYALQNKVTGKEYETQQFIYMRMAMAMGQNEPKATRIDYVKSMYQQLSAKRLSAPSPNYSNLGTRLKGFASCCLYTTKDTVASLAIGDYIALMMTASSAGIGSNLNVRSLGDPVRGGQISHNGKLPYFASMAKSVKANLQAGRGGACTTYYNGYDPESSVISQLRNPRSPEDKRNRDLHYALMLNRHFMTKVAKDEEAFSFNAFTAPDLMAAFYSADNDHFTALYKKYENDPNFKKVMFSPRKLLVRSISEAFETGVAYLAFMDEINRHTPFKEPIYSSNLCVAPETLLYHRGGEVRHGGFNETPIKDLVDRDVEIWNGHRWSSVRVVKTGVNQKLITVKLKSGRSLECTLYHKWYVCNNINSPDEVKRTHELFIGDKINPTIDDRILGVDVELDTVVAIIDEGRFDDTYCVHEPFANKAVFNGILTGQCLEIAEPTSAYDNIAQLVATSDVGSVTWDTTMGELLLPWSNKVVIKTDSGSKVTYAGEVKPGDELLHLTWDEQPVVVNTIIDAVKEPEIALCSLAAMNVAELEDENDYADAMYHALKMIDYCILNSEYTIPHLGYTAKQRMNAGVGIMGLATLMAKYQLKYDSKEGLEFLHRVAERHMYHAIKASIRISKERGLAPWIHKTKWVDGWTPLKTYNRRVDTLGDFELQYDWDALSEEIKQNGGIAHSVLVAYMPGESSSKALGQPNSIYPVRDITMTKTDNSTTIRWAAPYSDNPHYHYQPAWDVSEIDMINVYAVFQKFTDQTISADLWRKIVGDERVESVEMIQQAIHMVKHGIKTRYYYNTHTSSELGMTVSENINDWAAAGGDETGCAGGSCKI